MISAETKITLNANAPKAVKDGFKAYLKDGADVGFAHSQELVPEDRGTLRQSGYPPEWTQDGAIKWGYRAGHADDMEFGTGPFLADFDPLVEWAERQGGGYGLAVYVWRKIAREGIDAQPYAQPGAEKQEQWYEAREISSYIKDRLK